MSRFSVTKQFFFRYGLFQFSIFPAPKTPPQPKNKNCTVSMGEYYGAGKKNLGGHHIPDDVIRQTFDAGWKNFEELYKPLVDEWFLYDNTNIAPKLIDKGGKL